MAICKCKMCGGDLHIEETDKIIECDYCGTTQTVPSADSEKKMTLFNRANRLRLNNEFDKAAGIYESIVAEFPEEAEAYWGIVLCKYGIEYVDDPATGKKIPTCHRSSFESVFEDDAFDQACENADAGSRRIYRDEAKQIEEIRKGILEVSSKEEPYDIFICYKETDENGDRTIDSVIAQDVYDALTEKGYRVFFSRITLEDKLGREYEPYIFAALNSAKVMLVFGTDYEYFNAVWVKNEWSRFLQLISAGQKKVLIPCYKGIDAYDMPKEFARLQSQDMGKVGAIQDLLRGIEKLLPRSGAAAQPAPAAVAASPAAATVDSLLKRAFMFLEDGNWQSADEYAEKVLDIDPENGEAYLAKAMAGMKVAKREDLPEQYYQNENYLDQNNNIKKALRFGTDTLKHELNGYIHSIRETIETEKRKKEQREEEKEKKETEEKTTYENALEEYRGAYEQWENECSRLQKEIDSHIQSVEFDIRKKVEASLKEKLNHSSLELSKALNQKKDLENKLRSISPFKLNEKLELKQKITEVDKMIRERIESVNEAKEQYKNRESTIVKAFNEEIEKRKESIKSAFVLPEEPKKPEKPLSIRRKEQAERVVRSVPHSEENYELKRAIVEMMRTEDSMTLSDLIQLIRANPRFMKLSLLTITEVVRQMVNKEFIYREENNGEVYYSLLQREKTIHDSSSSKQLERSFQEKKKANSPLEKSQKKELKEKAARITALREEKSSLELKLRIRPANRSFNRRETEKRLVEVEKELEELMK